MLSSRTAYYRILKCCNVSCSKSSNCSFVGAALAKPTTEKPPPTNIADEVQKMVDHIVVRDANGNVVMEESFDPEITEVRHEEKNEDLCQISYLYRGIFCSLIACHSLHRPRP